MTFRLRITANLLFLVFAASLVGQAQFDFGDAAAETGDRFGKATARGDFNGDGYQDLAVGVPDEDIAIGTQSVTNAGAVEVLYGTAQGLSTAARQLWRQGGAGLHDAPEPYDNFGAALAGGDFNGDGFDDLAIGVPYEDLSGVRDVGAVHVLYGSATGLSTASVPAQFWFYGSWTSNVTGEQDARLGTALVAGNFDGDADDDLAIGIPGEDLTPPCSFVACFDDIVDAGRVLTLYGSATGLSSVGRQVWSQAGSRTDEAEAGDLFGSALATGDFNGDGFDDLAVGAAGESVGDIQFAGAVSIIHGSGTGLTYRGSHFWHQNKAGISDVAEAGDFFGSSLAAGDFNGDGFDDLAIGVRGEDLGPIGRGADAGAVHILDGSPFGLNGGFMRDQFWHQGVPDVQDRVESDDAFGASLTAGDFNGDGFDDLAIGIPGEDVDTLVVGTVLNAGAVSVIHGSAFGISATTVPDQLWHQARTGIDDAPGTNDNFGRSVTAGDFNGDGVDDLAVGVPLDDLSGLAGVVADAGGVSIIHGSVAGLNAIVPDQFWTQIVVQRPQP